MNRKIIIGGVIGLVLLLVLLLVVTAFGGKKKIKTHLTSDQVTLTFWGIDDDTAVMDPYIQDYQKEHGNIKVQYKKLERATYESQLVDALAAGKGPDLFEVHNTWLPRYFDKISAAPSDVYKSEDYARDFAKVVTDSTVVNGKIYGIPFYLDTLGLYSNNKLLGAADLSDAPKTWEDLVGKAGAKPTDRMITKLNNRQGNTFNQSGIALGNTKISRAPDVLALMMLQQHTEMINANHDKATFNLPQKVEGKDEHLGTEALNFYTSFADPKKANYSWNESLGDPVKAFASGKVAMIIGYPYLKAQIEKLNPDLQYSVSPVPQIGAQDPVNFASFWPNVVSKTSSHQTEAWDFIKFMSDKPQLTTYLDTTQRVSPRKDLPGISKLSAFYQQNDSAVTWFEGDAARTDGIMNELISRVLRGEDTQRAIDAAADQQTGVLADVKQRFGQPQ